ncbi:hypothetical protein [Nonomuraea roseola]
MSDCSRGDRPVADAVRAGDLVLDDPGGLVEPLLRLFPLPEPAVPPNDAG